MLLSRTFPLMTYHGCETGIRSRAAAFAGADEMAVLVALALAKTLVTRMMVVMVVVVTEVVVMVVEGGRAV